MIHQDQFKGDSNYYQRETTRIEAKDLLKIFDGEEGVKEEGTVKKGFEAVDYSNTLRDIMDDQELDSLLDRSDEAMNDGGSVI